MLLAECWSKEAGCGWACSQCFGNRERAESLAASNSWIVSKLTFSSDVMSAYSSSEKTLASLHGSANEEMLWPEAVPKKNFDLTDCLDPGNGRQYEIIRMFKNHNCGNVAKTMSEGFKLKSCTAADHKFLFCTSKCFRKKKLKSPWAFQIRNLEALSKLQFIVLQFCVRNLNASSGN